MSALRALQTTQIQAGNLMTLVNCYDSNQVTGSVNCSGLSFGAANNGNLQGQKITRLVGSTTLNFDERYTYDGVHRLATFAETSGPGENYSYDPFGNRLVTAHTGFPSALTAETPQFTTDFDPESAAPAGTPRNNRVKGWCYDQAGNLLRIPVTPTQCSTGQASRRIMTYDAENRQLTASVFDGAAASYSYDGDGKRVSKTVGGATTYFVYDAAGQLAMEIAASNPDTGTKYLHVDQLGSTRLVTNNAGTAEKCYDYQPFGGEMPVTNGRTGCYSAQTGGVEYTGQLRDAESNLDYFGARYYANVQGRFASVDPSLTASLRNPQTWNRYAYANNRPLTFVDPDGRWPKGVHEMLIDRAFPGLSKAQRKELKMASFTADTVHMFSPERHYTRAPGQQGPLAKRRSEKFINTQLEAAQVGQSFPVDDVIHINPDSLWEFGYALHAVMDTTSPAHNDENGDPAEYEFDIVSTTPFRKILEHSAKEGAPPTSAQINSAVSLMRSFFEQAYGQQALRQASEKPVVACVGVIDSTGKLSQQCTQ